MLSVACVASRVRFVKCMILHDNNLRKLSKCNALQRECNAKAKLSAALLRAHLPLGNARNATSEMRATRYFISGENKMRKFKLTSGEIINLPETLAEKLATITSLDELYGFANKRGVLGLDLPKWTDEERRLILARKYELQRKRKG